MWSWRFKQTHVRLNVLAARSALPQTFCSVKCVPGAALLIINCSVGFGMVDEGSLTQPAVTAIYRSVTEEEVGQRRELKSI